ncbi:hypothetical protein BDV23DRAFT_162144 [Aspergillus alliaceus]|uniref:Uncharacterized protein n=1 Tax=Petromyces alliaceus TaxID=209559 RepID=A0A5N7BYT0_PETAA|nr:hypothetical protein BDV23DRAFT_162144 [Aspergillus alliaceus]
MGHTDYARYIDILHAHEALGYGVMSRATDPDIDARIMSKDAEKTITPDDMVNLEFTFGQR